MSNGKEFGGSAKHTRGPPGPSCAHRAGLRAVQAVGTGPVSVATSASPEPGASPRRVTPHTWG